MRVLVTGGTGVVGRAATLALVEHGHQVRLLARNAERDAAEWPTGVEAFEGSVTEPESLDGSADGCDAVLHLAAIVRETPPEATFEGVNVGGTRNVLAEAARAGVRRFVYVSSLGADTGASEYHQTKFAGEELARRYEAGEWLVLRPGNVYGPGDEIISLLLKMVRVLPAVPTIDGGDHEFQPMWVGDLGETLARAVEMDGLAGRTLDLTGPDRTCMNDLIDRFRDLTGRSPLRIPTPGFLATFGARLGELLGFDLPINAGQIQMLEEGSVIADPRDNALTEVFHVEPTGLTDGLRKLADALPEQEPHEGIGGLKHRHVWVDIHGCRETPERLFELFRQRFDEVTPWHMQIGAEPGTSKVPEEGETLTMHLPVRGNIQVRIVEVTPTSLVLVTLEGHPLAGAVHFRCATTSENLVRFEVLVYDRAANVADWVVMAAGGGAIQRMTWQGIAGAVAEMSGGSAPEGVQHESTTLHGADAERVEQWIRELVLERKRESHATGTEPGAEASARDVGD